MNRHTIFTVCTELMFSVHRADCERAFQPYSSGGGYDFYGLKTSPLLPHVRVGNRAFSHRAFSHSLDVDLKMYIYILITIFFHMHTTRNVIIN